jgi:hypothetical protein
MSSEIAAMPSAGDVAEELARRYESEMIAP